MMWWDDAEPLSFGSSYAVSSAKAMTVRLAMAIIMFLTGTYVGVDWASYFYGFTSHYSPMAGYVRTLLCALIVFVIGSNRVSRRDHRLLVVAFGMTLIADYFLILKDQMMPGTLLFLIVHGMLIVRHGQGLRCSLMPGRRARSVAFLVLTAAVVYGGSALLIWQVAPMLARTKMLAIDTIYVMVLATSTWMAWGTLARTFYDRRNAWLIALGMTSFYFCDVSVGLAAALGKTKAGMILGNLVGFFYSPALVMLAFSGYRWVTRAQ